MASFIMLLVSLLFILCFSLYYITAIFRLSDYESELKKLDRMVDNYGGAYNYYLRGRLYHKHDDYRYALADYNEAIRLEPHNLEYYLEKAELHKRFDRCEQVEETFNQMVEANPGNPLAYHHRAFCRLKRRRFSDAVSDYLKVKELLPEKVYVQNYHIFRAIEQYYYNNFEDSLENLKIAADIYPHNLIYILNHMVYCKCGNYEKVLDNFNELKVKCALKDDTYHILLGEFYKDIGEREKACECYKAAVNQLYITGEQSPQYYYARGNVELLQGNEKSAAKLLDEFLDFEEHKEFFDHLYEMVYHISRIKCFMMRNDIYDAREELKFIDKYNDLYYTCLPFLDGIINQVQGVH